MRLPAFNIRRSIKRMTKEPRIDPRVAEPFAEASRSVVLLCRIRKPPFVETRFLHQAESGHNSPQSLDEPSVEKRSEVLIKEADDYSM